jgi:Tfp pilus assembly protein PilF
MQKVIKKWGAIAAVIIATATIIGYLFSLNAERRKMDKCQSLLKTADDYSALDNFEVALSQLEEARQYCDDRDVDLRMQEAKTFKVAGEYDQVKLVRNPEVVREVEVNVHRLGNELGDTARLAALRGILEELSDRPESAVKIFDSAGRGGNANILNYWGYTIYKWELGGATWPSDALEKFGRAIMANPAYAWPYINSAAVYLRQAEDAMAEDDPGRKRSDPDAASAFLNNAKESLDKADKLLPGNPRVNILRGNYKRLLGRVLRARNISDWVKYFYDAKDDYIKARSANPADADASYLLGVIYEELGEGHEGDALTEYRNATKSDGARVEAVMNLAYYLLRSGNKEDAAKELKRAASLLTSLQESFYNRSLSTTDLSARQWLSKRISYYKGMEQDLRAMEKGIKGAVKTKKPR